MGGLTVRWGDKSFGEESTGGRFFQVEGVSANFRLLAGLPSIFPRRIKSTVYDKSFFARIGNDI